LSAYLSVATIARSIASFTATMSTTGFNYQCPCSVLRVSFLDFLSFLLSLASGSAIRYRNCVFRVRDFISIRVSRDR